MFKIQYYYSRLSLGAASVAKSRSIWGHGTHQLAAARVVLPRGLDSATASRTGTADPAVHAGGDYESDPGLTTADPQGTEDVAQEKPAADEQRGASGRGKGTGAFAPPNKPSYPNASSPRLENTGMNLQPSDHPTNYTQKRHISSHGRAATSFLEKVSCVGLDGTPLSIDSSNERDMQEKEKSMRDGDRDRKEEREEDDREYYKHHKASSLSEVEYADTRKPITRATDGTPDSVSESGAGRDVVGWRPEQLDTAEEALRRAARIWKENAIRGDPDAPQSRVLRALRGESF
ncbi:hypothetical protein D8674_022931 [Pyrus ussuriensis x Pyrus communis]|uniref:Uncharacterized protein n=2 Tax=Pyrus TaxID=3766 RepID=A0A5N5GNI8_9ROSA|nr:hypothetical protein D8674_022931 [Pyrus ussuriensis x Pyrus communis]